MRKTEIEETNMTDINKIENGPMLNLYPDSLGGIVQSVSQVSGTTFFHMCVSTIQLSGLIC